MKTCLRATVSETIQEGKTVLNFSKTDLDHFKGSYDNLRDMSGRPIYRFDVLATSYGREYLGNIGDHKSSFRAKIDSWHQSSLDLYIVVGINNIGTSLDGLCLRTGNHRKTNNYLKSKFRKIPLECLSPIERKNYKKIVKEYVNSSSRKSISFGW